MVSPSPAEWWMQIVWLLVLSLVVACVAWTVTHEEIFREPREYCSRRAQADPRPILRKAFYVVTCEYCFSHWVALGVVALMRFRLLVTDWRGYLLAVFAVVAVANAYMSAFGRLRQEVKYEGLEARRMEQALEFAGGSTATPNARPGGAGVSREPPRRGASLAPELQPPAGPSPELPSGKATREG
jgi:hypothetical protein